MFEKRGSGSVSFEVTPTQGIPGSPESPLIYAAVMEFLIEETETKVYGNQRPFGVQVAGVDPDRC